MNLKSVTGLVSIALTLIILSGCKSTPILNLSEQMVPSTFERKLTLKEVKEAITHAGIEQGWVMDDDKKNEITATLNSKDTQASVTIKYTQYNYTVKYRSSRNLKYDGMHISQSYNNRLTLLNNTITEQLRKHLTHLKT